MVGLHHIVRPFASWVVAFSTVHESPGEGAWAKAPPAPNAIGETAMIAYTVAVENRNLLIMDIS